MKKLLYALATPPGKWFHLAVFAVVLMGCYYGAFMGQAPTQFTAATALALMTISALWVIRLFLYGWSFEDPEFAPKKAAWKRWFITPAMLVAAYLLIAAMVPVWAMFLLNYPALNRFATSVQQLPSNQLPPDQWVGMYHARSIRKADNGVQFWVNTAGTEAYPFFYFHYFPTTSPDQLGSHLYPLINGWYYSVEFQDLTSNEE